MGDAAAVDADRAGARQEHVEVEIHPPRLPSTAAGPTGLVVRVAAQDRADAAVIEAAITLDVAAGAANGASPCCNRPSAAASGRRTS